MWESYYYDDDVDDGHYEAITKNQKNIQKLKCIRKDALGIGTNKLKRRLNKLSENDINSKIIRILLEIEDVSTQAKDTSYKYKQKKYDQKDRLLRELLDIYFNTTFKFGYQKSDVPITKYIFYFHLPDDVQVSFHSNLSDLRDVPKYEMKWDGKVNSTFDKILNFIYNNYPSIYKEG
jgi:hypothetical protein